MISPRLGFMQGRLSPRVGKLIQAFPWDHWREEFPLAQELKLTLMEWTLDHDRLSENPFMTAAGQKEIRELSARYGVRIESVTGDNFMQAPFYKVAGEKSEALLEELKAVIRASAALEVKYVVFPLVDNGAVNGEGETQTALAGFRSVLPLLQKHNVTIVFEMERPPPDAMAFLNQLDPASFGVNYDIGNSASIGLDPDYELPFYGTRVGNVHIKDRLKGGTTVPLGTGSAKLPKAFQVLKAIGYPGNFILQTARAADDDHVGALKKYRDQVLRWYGET